MLTIKTKSVGQGTTKVTTQAGAEVETKATTKMVDTDGTLVGFKVGHTMNLGNYESAKFEVVLILPSTIENIDSDFQACQEWADSKLAGVISEANSEVK